MSSRTKQYFNNQSQKLLVVKTSMMKTGKQLELFKKPVKKLSTYRCKIPYTDSWINYIQESKKWKLKLLRICKNYGYEMLSINTSKTKKTNMEYIPKRMGATRMATMRKMCSMHKPENNGMDLQTG